MFSHGNSETSQNYVLKDIVLEEECMFGAAGSWNNGVSEYKDTRFRTTHNLTAVQHASDIKCESITEDRLLHLNQAVRLYE